MQHANATARGVHETPEDSLFVEMLILRKDFAKLGGLVILFSFVPQETPLPGRELREKFRILGLEAENFQEICFC